MDRSKRYLVIPILYGCIPLLAVFDLRDAWINILSAILSCAVAAIACRVVKRRSAHDIHGKQVAVLMAAFAVIAIACYFLVGIAFGFYRVVLLASLVFTHVIPFAVIIISSEILRSVLLDQRSRALTVLSYVAFVLFDVSVLTQTGAEGEALFRVIGSAVFPTLLANILYHYISERYGALPNILYRIIIVSYPYFVPLRPQMPEAILAFARMLLPIFILSFIYRLYKKRRRELPRKRSRSSVVGSVSVLVLCSAFIMLVSGAFRYKLLVIGSDSMSGVMDKGDAIVYEEYTDQNIREGQIILFERDDIIIVHRVVDIESVNGKPRYYTKGDANDTADVGYITDEQILGVKRLTLKYVGYPAVWARSLYIKK